MTSQSSNESSSHAQQRPLFIYGTLCAMPLLAWLLTGDPQKTAIVSKLARKAVVKGYARYTVRGMDYPAVIEDEDSSVDGLVLVPLNCTQRAKLDRFEGGMYKVTPVLATVVDGSGGEEKIDADIYVWSEERDAVSSEPWDLDTFIRECLDDWLPSPYAGLNVVDDDESDEEV